MSFGPISTVICEDEPLAIRALKRYLGEVEWVDIVGEAQDGGSALRLIQKLEPDLVFMDIHMPGPSGLDVLNAATHLPCIVFTTAYDQYAVPAFELGAVDYLLKPFGRERLLETLERVRIKLLGEGRSKGPNQLPVAAFPDRILGRDGSTMVPISVEEIIRIRPGQSGVVVVTQDGEYSVPDTMGEISGRLDPTNFVRVHRAHMVNLGHVRAIRRYDDRRLSVALSDGTQVVTSRSGTALLRNAMG